MSSSAPENLLTEWARLFVESLFDAGVRRAVISPGSRSTPIVAALEDANRFEIDIAIDERCAAYIALGHGKLSGLPSVCVCTSGSAAAHYFPALLEAEASGTPLLVVTADRPPELHENRAPQTIAQNQLFGNKVRAFFELGVPEASADVLRGLRRKTLQAVATTRHPRPGPVHLNFQARKPLEPNAKVNPATVLLRQQVDQLIAKKTLFAPPRLEPTSDAIEPLLEAARKAKRPALVLGPMAPHAACDPELLSEFAARSGWPVFCEVTSQARFSPRPHGITLCDGFDLVFRALMNATNSSAGLSVSRELKPDFVLQFGDPPVSGAWAALLKRQTELTRFVVSPHAWPDPQNNADAILAIDPNALLYPLIGCVPVASVGWRSACVAASQKAWAAVAKECEREVSELSEGPALHLVGEALRDGDLLLLGNSMPVRLAETFLRCRSAHIPVVSQRGASGIDGWLSMATGASRVHSELSHQADSRTFAVIGDITFLHDAGGLLNMGRQRPNLTLLVLNNGGGRIFEHLPLAGQRSLGAWTTPHDVELHRLASCYNIPAFRADSSATLTEALKLARNTGPALIEVVVTPHGANETYERIVAHLQADLMGTLTSPPSQK